MRAVEKYLKNYAEIECSALSTLPAQQTYKHCVIIPAYDEAPDFVERLIAPRGLLPASQALAVIVINQPDTVATSLGNLQLEQYLRDTLPTLWQSENLTLLGETHWGILLVERYRSTPIPRKQGVGLARKIAADLCVSLIHSGLVKSQWIHSTDADAHLPGNYFETSSTLKGPAALTYRYRHRQNNTIASTATQLYQTSLEYYVEGLRWAGSPYAFHTLGSIIAADYQAYSQVRGFPKRAGGEDFYLLNKLAKLGHITTPECTIELEPRVSHRVPFGTGPAVEKILNDQQQGLPRSDYSPEVFKHLKQLLSSVGRALKEGSDVTNALSSLPACTIEAMEDLGIENLEKHLSGKTHTQKLQHFHLWFDGFRTLKFIHYLQRHHFPPEPLAMPLAALFEQLEKE